ncbi:MAG: hypothetical protein ACK5L3_04520, partial [Oscillospiraceae bacterium]
MAKKSEKLFELAGQVADAALQTTTNLVEKGKEKVDLYTLENRLKRGQRQLGILVYTLQKNGETNEGLIKRYVEEIDKVRAEIALLNGKKADTVAVHVCPACGTGVKKDAMFCGSCG